MIRHALAALCLCLLPLAATAQELPALYDVTGVATNDTLNVRAGPSTDFDVVDKLAPDAREVEVVDLNDEGDWALISTAEGRGWVALRYLARAGGQPAEGLPRQLSCSGTEPFWGFSLRPDRSAEFSRPEQSVAFASVLDVPSQNRTDRYALFADGGKSKTVITALVSRNLCSDGMSDRAYGLSIDMLVTDEKAVTLYSGCCSVKASP
ncbi:MAG: SH3 domain-containing protein [Roseovarius sp.]